MTANEDANETVNGDANLESDYSVRGPCLLLLLDRNLKQHKKINIHT